MFQFLEALQFFVFYLLNTQLKIHQAADFHLSTESLVGNNFRFFSAFRLTLFSDSMALVV